MLAFTAPVFAGRGTATPRFSKRCHRYRAHFSMCASASSHDRNVQPSTPSASMSTPSVTTRAHEPTIVDKGAGASFSGGNSWNGNDGHGNHGDDGMAGDEELSALLRSRNAVLSDIPNDILQAYQRGTISLSVISNYFHARANFLARVLMACGSGMRNRFLADKLFLLKIAIEEGIGIFGKLSAEYEARKDRFWIEKEFVGANLLSALLADFALVYFPAPSVRLAPSVAASGWRAKFAAAAQSLPTSVFQTDRTFTMAQRAATFGLKAGQLFLVGFACSLTSILITNSIVYIKEKTSDYKSETQKQNAILVPALYGTFLGTSSNTRYQLVNGVESLVFPRIFRTSPKLLEEGSTFALRYANTFFGSIQWVWFCALTGAQKLKEKEHSD